MDDRAAALLFWVAADCVIEADRLLAEANRCERYNPPWARNRRRRAARLMDRARTFCGGRSLPWGVAWPEE